MRVVRLRFHRGLRAGAPGWGLEQDEEFLRADTLYSALTLAALELKGRPLPPLRLTSAFPFANGEYYFPRPLLRHPMLERADVRARYGRLMRELRLLNLDDFLAWLAGRHVDIEAAARREEALRRKIRKVLRPRVALDRPRQNSALYFVTERRFAPDGALFCLVDCAPEDWLAVE
ncbi:MAG: hypothetical protein H5T97_02715, partial [Firmicutes bacterium]|nr:hypothetical protein [Bacillota bacterium]